MVGTRRARLKAGILAATKDCANPSYELAWIEGLAEVIVSTDFETDNPIDILLQGGEQDDRYVRSRRSQIAAEVQSRPVGQHHIKDDEINLIGHNLLVHLCALRCEQNAKTLLLHVAGEEFTDFGIVIDNENLRVCAHDQL
jgi:hypothetical protein